MVEENPFESPSGKSEEKVQSSEESAFGFRTRMTILLTLCVFEVLFILAGLFWIRVVSPSGPRPAGGIPANSGALSLMLIVGVVLLFTIGVTISVLLDRAMRNSTRGS